MAKLAMTGLVLPGISIVLPSLIAVVSKCLGVVLSHVPVW